MSVKKRLLMLTALALAAPVLAGSGSAAAADAKGGLISIIVNDPSNPYWLTEGNVAAAEAEKLGYKATVGASKGDTNTESNLVDTAVTNRSVAIILDPANASGSIGAVKKAIAANIPVILVNAEINQDGLAKAQLVSNNAQGAALGAQQWVKDVGQKGHYVELLGSPSDNNAATRSNGFETVLSQYDGLDKVGSQVASWDRTQGHDKMPLGAIAALKEAGKLSSIKVGGFDGSPDAVTAVKAGELQYTVLQPVATFSAKAVQEADAFLKTGKTGAASEKQLFDCVLITKANAGKMTAPFTLEK